MSKKIVVTGGSGSAATFVIRELISNNKAKQMLGWESRYSWWNVVSGE